MAMPTPLPRVITLMLRFTGNHNRRDELRHEDYVLVDPTLDLLQANDDVGPVCVFTVSDDGRSLQLIATFVSAAGALEAGFVDAPSPALLNLFRRGVALVAPNDVPCECRATSFSMCTRDPDICRL